MEHEAESIASAVVPYFPDDHRKSKYLSFRTTGFPFREACKLANISISTVRNWRATDEEFAKMDLTGISDLKSQLGMKYLDIEFTRNMRLALQKDLMVLMKSITKDDSLTQQKHQYLLKIRQFYTPQQLILIQELAKSGSGDGHFDFTKLVFEIRREREQISIRGAVGEETT